MCYQPISEGPTLHDSPSVEESKIAVGLEKAGDGGEKQEVAF